MLLAILLFGLFGGTALAQQKVLTGTVSYLERMALPPGATLTVELADITVAGAADQLVAQTRLPAAQPPISFSLPFDIGRIEAGHRYALRAEVAAGGATLFATDDDVVVDPLSALYPVDITLTRAGGGAAPSEDDDDSGD
jgi:putative lipoprotein